MITTEKDQTSLNEATQKPDVVYDPMESGRDTSATLEDQLRTAADLIGSGLEKQRVGREDHYRGLAQTYGIWLAVLEDETLTEKVGELYEAAKAASSLNSKEFIKGVPNLLDQVVATQFPEVKYQRRKENANVLTAARHANISVQTFISWMKKSGGKTAIHNPNKPHPLYGYSKRLLDLCEHAKNSSKNPTDVLLDSGDLYAMIVHRVGPDYEVMSVIVDKKGSRKAVNTHVAKQILPDKATLLASVDILPPAGQSEPEPALDDEPIAVAS